MILTIYQFLIEMLPFVPFVVDGPQGSVIGSAKPPADKPEAAKNQAIRCPERASSGYG